MTVGLLSFVNIPTGHKAQVNLNIFTGGIDYPFLNAAKVADPFGVNNSSQDINSLINADGYPTAIAAGTSNWTSNTFVYYPGTESTFTGSVTGTALTVSGSVTGVPLFIGQTVSGTGITAQSRIVSGSGLSWVLSQSSSATGSISINGFVPYVLDWVGAASGLSLGIGGPLCNSFATNIGTNRIEVRIQSMGGATFTIVSVAGSMMTVSGITGTIIVGAYVTGPGIPPLTTITGTGGAGQYFMSATLSYTTSGAGATLGIALGDAMLAQIIVSSVPTALSNVRLYLQTDEVALNAGNLLSAKFKSTYQPYGRLRFMNWQETNGSMLANWTNRPKSTNYTYNGTNVLLTGAYCGLCPVPTNNDYVGLSALSGNPSVWVDGMTVQATASNCPAACQITGKIDNGSGSPGNTLTVSAVVSGAVRIGLSIRKLGGNGIPTTCTITAGSGTSWTVDGGTQNTGVIPMLGYARITAVSTGATTTITSPTHGFINGDVVIFPVGEINSTGGSISIDTALNGAGGVSGTNYTNTYAVSSVTTNTFVLTGVNSTTWGSWVSGGVILYQIRFKTGLLPFKNITSKGMSAFFIQGQLDSFALTTNSIANTFVYNATADALIFGGTNEVRSGLPIETACAIANEINGPDMWLCIPHLATDDFVTQMATAIKTNLNSNLHWCMELSNEVWNQGGGFQQTPFAIAMGNIKWGLTDSNSGLDQWYGWRFYNIVQLINATAIGIQCIRIMGFRTDGQFENTLRLNAPATGVAAAPITVCDQFCFAPYVGMQYVNTPWPQAVDVYNYQQGVLTSNNTLIQSALNAIDAYFNCSGIGPFDNISATIDNGSGTGSPAGTTLTVTAINNNVNPPHSNLPVLGAFTPLQDYGGSSPATGTYIVSQLTGTPGGIGTYQVSVSQAKTGPTFGADSNNIYGLIHNYFPFWAAQATTFGKPICNYEGGFGILTFQQNNPTTFSGNPLNAQDTLNLLIAYQNSSQWATSFLALLNAYKAQGGKFYSQYQLTGTAPNNSNMFQIIYPTIYGPVPPQKTNALDVYNAS